MIGRATENSIEVILMGDVNMNFLVSGENREFKSILNLCGVKQLVSQPTRITEATESLIDIIASNRPINIKSTKVIPTSIRDHDMVGCVRKLNSLKFISKVITCRDYKHHNPDKIIEELRSLDWTKVYQNTN